MEGSENEAVFESLNLNPQLFINEVLNSVDDLLEEAFSFFNQQASEILKTDGTDRSEELKKGTAHIRNMIQSNLDKRLSMWEKYCLSHCFSVPEGFTLPKADHTSSSGASLDLDALDDSELDMQLDSLREKITQVGQECSVLNREIQKVEKESSLVSHSAASRDEALQLYEKHSSHEMFQELIVTGSAFRMKTEKLKTPDSRMMDKLELVRADMTNMQNGELLQTNGNIDIGLPNMKLEELEGLLDIMKK